MRVLDIGGSDGYIGAWLRERYDGDVQVDVIDMSMDAIERAAKRGMTAKLGRAEDAPRLFTPENYDAVLMFELIEHVHDVDALLSAAERMLKPGGRCYVSTPDGTFGTGNNPNHLRAFRAVDLADILRRRGELHDMMVGPDGVTVAAYTPARRIGEIAIYTGPSWMPWSPMDIATKGLGGSETAAVRLAENLSDHGFVVTVYGEVEECAWRDVMFRHHLVFDPLERRDAVISSRLPHIFDRPVAATRKILWLHDVDAGDQLTTRRADQIDFIVVLSDWHRRHVEGRYPFARAKVVQLRNGINLDYFRQEVAA